MKDTNDSLKLLEQAGKVIEDAAERSDPKTMDEGPIEELLEGLGLSTRALAKYSLQWMIANNEQPMTATVLVSGIALAAAILAIREGRVEVPDDATDAELSEYEGPVH